MHSRQTILLDVQFSRNPVGPNVVWLEDRSEAVVFLLRDRVILVVVTPTAVESDSQKSLRRVLHCIIEPYVAVKLVPVAGEKSSRSQ